MEISLKKKLDIKLALIPIVAIVIIFNASNIPSLSEYLPIVIAVVIVLFVYRMYKLIMYPAAKIIADTLIIYDAGSPIKIEKENIENLSYTEVSKSKHEIEVKQNGYEAWIITIDDKPNHISENRLFKFINDNFWKIIPNN
jgi:hypothetical protein